MRTLKQVEKDIWLLIKEADEIINAESKNILRFRFTIYMSQFKRDIKNFFINCDHDSKNENLK